MTRRLFLAASLALLAAPTLAQGEYRLVVKERHQPWRHVGWLECLTRKGWRPTFYLEKDGPYWRKYELNEATGGYFEVPNGRPIPPRMNEV